MKMLAIMICFSLQSCALIPIRVPVPAPLAYERHHHRHHHPSPKVKGIVVNPEWLSRYKQLELEHGNYTVPSDSDIHEDSAGGFIVPTESARHFSDMLKASPTTTPAK